MDRRAVALSLALIVIGCTEPEASVAEPTPPEVEEPPPPPPVRWARESLDPLGAEHIVERPIELMVPQGDPPADGWPFLVVTDGDLAFRDAYRVGETLRMLVDAGAVQPTLVIAVPARERTEEMTPSRASMHSLRRGERVEDPGGGVESFADYVVDVVLSRVAQDHRLASSGAILGYSYGGLAAVHVGLRHPDRFSSVIAMSPSLWSAQRFVLGAVAEAERVPARFWIDVGTKEGHAGDVVPYMVADARQLRKDLVARGTQVGYYEVPGRDHGSDEAGQRMRWALAYGLGADECTPNRLDLHVFELYPRRRQRVPTSVLARCEDDTPRTIAPADVQFRVEGEGGRIGVDGVFHGTRVGLVTIHAQAGELQASKHVQVTR